MLQIVKHFGWTWFGLVVTDNEYGHSAARSVQSEVERSGSACLAYMEALPLDSDPAELQRIVTVMKASTARVVIGFAFSGHIADLIKEVGVMMMMVTMGFMIKTNPLFVCFCIALQINS